MAQQAKVLATTPLAYWPANEGTGLAIADASGNGYHATASGITWAKGGPGGDWSPVFAGAAYINLLAAGMGAAWPYASGTIMAWAKLTDWSGATQRYILRGYNDPIDSEYRLYKNAANAFRAAYYPPSTPIGINTTPFAPGDWFPVVYQWDVASGKLWLKLAGGAKVEASGIQAFASDLIYLRAGTSWLGSLSDIAVWSRLLTDTELSSLEVYSVADKGKAIFTLMDYDREKTAVQIHHVALTAGNFAATETLLDALRDAIAQMTLGTMVQTRYGNEDLLSITPASDEQAQREAKWLVSYHDTTSLISYSCEIGTADFDQLDPGDRKHAHIGDSGIVDGFITAFEAVAKSPTGGAVVVDEITLVGRNV